MTQLLCKWSDINRCVLRPYIFLRPNGFFVLGNNREYFLGVIFYSPLVCGNFLSIIND